MSRSPEVRPSAAVTGTKSAAPTMTADVAAAPSRSLWVTTTSSSVAVSSALGMSKGGGAVGAGAVDSGVTAGSGGRPAVFCLWLEVTAGGALGSA